MNEEQYKQWRQWLSDNLRAYQKAESHEKMDELIETYGSSDMEPEEFWSNVRALQEEQEERK